MSIELYGRQGDLVIEVIALPDTEELIKRKDIVFAGDSSGHRHRLLGEVMVSSRNNGRVTRIKLDKDTELVHEKGGGHETIPMKAGTYQISPLRERGNSEDRAVED